MDVFSQTTTRGSTEVPKRLFSPATPLSVTGPLTDSPADGVRDSDFIKQTRAENTLYQTSHSSCIRVFY